ncbi:37S ribosomal protein MRP4, mitochondrial [Candida viswanathii]|uniref:37S ribosomal protein MRP4, mitochondrial n=1 Tax=Candida viswanathii TaxID=5486 RepID=A0A367XW99_9ASCO|nr:37S ribosomal protein MRP4, mitochondrial [Candida viswanathii]
MLRPSIRSGSGVFMNLPKRAFSQSLRLPSNEEPSKKENLSQKELRPKDQRFNGREQTLITTLNNTPTTLIHQRLAKLNEDLNKLPQEKVKNLDEKLRSFLRENIALPSSSVANRPWVEQKNGADGDATNLISGYGGAAAHAGAAFMARGVASNVSEEFPRLQPTADYKPYSKQELYLRQLNHSKTIGRLGSRVAGVFRPHRDVTAPQPFSKTSIAKLMAAGCHLGHATSASRASTQPFIYGVYDKINIIDLEQTLEKLQLACKVVEGVVEKGGIVLFVGTYKNEFIDNALLRASERCKGFYVNKRWLPGTITNFTEVTSQVSGAVANVDMNMKDEKFEVKQNKKIVKPDLVVLLNPVDNRNCIKECISACIPTIGLCDTDMEPSLLSYPIPCNDDSARSVTLMLGILSKAGETGLKNRLNAIAKLENQAKEMIRRRADAQEIESAEENKNERTVFDVELLT